MHRDWSQYFPRNWNSWKVRQINQCYYYYHFDEFFSTYRWISNDSDDSWKLPWSTYWPFFLFRFQFSYSRGSASNKQNFNHTSEVESGNRIRKLPREIAYIGWTWLPLPKFFDGFILVYLCAKKIWFFSPHLPKI